MALLAELPTRSNGQIGQIAQVTKLLKLSPGQNAQIAKASAVGTGLQRWLGISRRGPIFSEKMAKMDNKTNLEKKDNYERELSYITSA